MSHEQGRAQGSFAAVVLIAGLGISGARAAPAPRDVENPFPLTNSTPVSRERSEPPAEPEVYEVEVQDTERRDEFGEAPPVAEAPRRRSRLQDYQPPPPEPLVRITASGGYDDGAAPIVQVRYDDGTEEMLHANRGPYVAAGVAVNALTLGDLRVGAHGAASLKWAQLRAEGGSVTYTAASLEAKARAELRYLRLACGMTYTVASSISGTGTLHELNADLERSLGLVGELGLVSNALVNGGRTRLTGGVRFIKQDLTDRATGATVSANSMGFFGGVEY
ncbi:MAG: hypothetical protein R3B48_25090 [Kofleriaceae bacterium]